MSKRFSNLGSLWVLTLMAVMGGIAQANIEENLIKNGDFADPIDFNFWSTYGNNTIISGQAHVGRPGPSHDSGIWQEFFVDPGVAGVRVSFDYLFRGNGNTALDDVFTVTLKYDDAALLEHELTLISVNNKSSSFGATVFFNESFGLPEKLNASAPNATILFELQESLTAENIGTRVELDNMIVTPVPEMEVWAMISVGLCFIAYRLRRKQRLRSGWVQEK